MCSTPRADRSVLLNNELRFPLIRMFDGAGLRVRTKWVLVRGDYGVVLDPRDGERRGRFYFSIGQAF